jgi:hypothetical protein
MLFRRWIAFALFATLFVNTCEAAVQIDNDLGGRLGDYILRYSGISQSGESVVINGRCYSACTTVVGMVPHGRICVTPQAVLGFHAALAPDQAGRLIIDSNATRLMYDMYPKPIQNWLNFNGGLAKRMIYLSGADLKKLYRECRQALSK